MNDMTKRLASFDIAKAVVLIAVVVGHCSFVGAPQGIVKACISKIPVLSSMLKFVGKNSLAFLHAPC